MNASAPSAAPAPRPAFHTALKRGLLEHEVSATLKARDKAAGRRGRSPRNWMVTMPHEFTAGPAALCRKPNRRDLSALVFRNRSWVFGRGRQMAVAVITLMVLPVAFGAEIAWPCRC